MQQNPQFRHAYLQMFVSGVVEDGRITDAGTKNALEAALSAGYDSRPPAVPKSTGSGAPRTTKLGTQIIGEL